MYTTDDVLRALTLFVQGNVSGCFLGVVSNTDKAESEGTIEVESNQLSYEVRLQAVSSQAAVGILLVPKVGSSVFCAAEGNSDSSFVAVSFSEVEKLRLAIGSTAIVADKERVVFNGGGLGSLVAIEPLVRRLNSIERAFNSLLDSYKAHNHNHPQGATVSLVAPYEAAEISETAVSEIENDKIKQ